MGIYTSKLLDENFDLGKAIRSNEVDLIFGDNWYDLLDESYKHNGKDSMQMIIRNKEEDKIDHEFTMKFTPKDGNRRDDKRFYHNGHYGLPISFTRGSKEWHVDFGKGKDSIKQAKTVEKSLKKREKQFISAVVDEIGNEILDYWEVENIHTIEGKQKLNDIVERIQAKYEK